MQRRAFVLLSGGLDSTTALHKAIIAYRPDGIPVGQAIRTISGDDSEGLEIDWVEAISVNYGQRHLKEIEFAHSTCEKFGIPHRVLDLRGILSGEGVMLTDANVQVPDIDYADIKGVYPTYVPFRNGTLLSLITAHAQKWVNNEIKHLVDTNIVLKGHPKATQAATEMIRDSVGIYFGAHSEDAQNWAYPDCTPEFIGSMANAIYTGSYYAIRLHTPLQWMMKKDIVRLGNELGVDFKNTWSCYVGGDKHCGICPTCRSRKTAFVQANVKDPTEYAA